MFLGPGFVTHFETIYFNFNFAFAHQTAYTTKFSGDPLEPPSALDRNCQEDPKLNIYIYIYIKNKIKKLKEKKKKNSFGHRQISQTKDLVPKKKKKDKTKPKKKKKIATILIVTNCDLWRKYDEYS